MFKIKYEIKKMYPIIFSNQVGWINGKEIDIHPWGLRIKLHNWYSCGQRLYVDHILLT